MKLAVSDLPPVPPSLVCGVKSVLLEVKEVARGRGRCLKKGNELSRRPFSDTCCSH